MSALWRAYGAWRVAAGPLADFVLPTPFLAPWEPATRAPQHPLARRMADGLQRRASAEPAQGRTMVILEAAPRLALAVGMRLRQAGWHVAPAIGRWSIEGAVLPSEPMTAWLVGALDGVGTGGPAGNPSAGPAGGPAGGAGADVGVRAAPAGDLTAPERRRALCVLLDAERRRRVTPAALRRRFDNRYDYGPQMLPPAARLRNWGVTQVLWVGPAAALPPDLTTYGEALVAAGVMVDLGRLADVA